MEIRRIGPDGAFIREFKGWQKRVQSIESKPAGKIFIRETLTTVDPETGVKTIIGELPDGTYGIQPFVGDTTPPPVASAPIAAAQPGTITVSWDGLFVNNEEKPKDFQHVNVIAHKVIDGITITSLVVGVIRLPTETVIVTGDILGTDETWEFSLESEDYNVNRADLSVRSAPVATLSLLDDSLVGEALAGLAGDLALADAAALAAQEAAQDAQDAADEVANDLTSTNAAVSAAQLKADQAAGAAQTAATNAGLAQTSADSKNRNWYLASAPAGNSHKSGDVWYDTDDGNKLYIYSVTPTATGWLPFQDAAIAAASQAATGAQASADGKSTNYYEPTAPTNVPVGKLKKGDSWFDTNNNYRLSTWSGSAWQGTQDAYAALQAANTKGKTLTQPTAPPVGDRLPQNLWVDTSLGLDQAVTKYWDPSALSGAGNWVAVSDKGIKAAQDTADAKGITIYSTSTPAVSAQLPQNLWIDTTGGININKRWVQGSGWVVVADSRIASSAAAVTAADAKAQTALSTATAKSVVYTQSTTPPVEARLPQTLWNDTSLGANNIVVKYWDTVGLAWTALADKAATDAATLAGSKSKVIYSTTAPTGADANVLTLWIDTTGGANTPKKWVSGTTWTAVTDKVAADAAALAASKGMVVYSDTAPAVSAQLPQNLWVDTTGGINLHKRWNGAWVVVADARISTTAAQVSALSSQVSAVSAQADRSITTFYGTTLSGTPEAGDIWLTGVAGEPMKRYNGSIWQTFEDPNVQAAYTKAGDAQAAADAKVRTWAQDTEPDNMVPNDVGDIWIDTNDNNKMWRYSGAVWVALQDGDIALAQQKADTALSSASAAATAAQGAQTSADGKSTNYYQDAQPTGGTYKIGDTWFDTNDGYKMRTYAGSNNWQLTQDSAGAQAAAILAAAGDATTKATNAQTAAINAASADATQKANDAEQAAIDAAALVAQAKANQAKQDAIDAAAITAQQKANDAKQAAIDAAAIVAQQKANGAEQNAIDAAAITAGNLAGIAEQAAIDAAAITAGQLATQAKTDAINAAAGDAQTRATQAKVDAEQAAAIDATTKADAAQRAAIQAQAYSLNPSFEDWTSTYPVNYGAFNTAPTKETTTVRTGKFAMRFNCTDATTQRGVTFASTLAHAPNLEYFTIEVDVRLDSGSSFGGAGVLLDWVGMTNNRATISLATEIPAPVVGKWYRVSKVVRRPTNATGTWTSMTGWLMGQYSSGMGTQAVKNVIFDWINVRPSSTEEITAFGTPASILTLSDTVNTKTKSWFQNGQPPLTGNTTGDLWFDTDDNNKIYIWNGTWAVASDQRIESLNSAVSAVQTSANGKNKIIWSTSTASGTTGYVAGDTWFQRDGSNNIIGQWEFTTSWQVRKMDDAIIANLNAGKLIAGTLDAQRIGANTIGASKMIVSDMEELIPNPLFHPNGEPVTTSAVILNSTTPVSAGAPFPYSYKLTSRDNNPFNATPNIAVKDGDQFLIEVWVAAAPTALRNFNIYMFGSSSPVGGLSAKTSTGNIAPTQTWTKVTWNYTVATGGAYNYIKPLLQLGTVGGETAAQLEWYATGFSMKRKNAGSLIVDGAIQANSAIIATGAIGTAHIADAAIKTAEIDNLAVTTAKIDNLAVKTAQIDNLAVTGAKIEDLAVTNAKIANATIQAAKIGSVDAGTITVGQLSAAQISATAIDGKTITGALIQTVNTPATGTSARGIKLTPTELMGFDAAGNKNLSLTSAGALTLKGEIKSGSTIEGARITGTSGIETAIGSTTGVKITTTGIKAYDGGGSLSFHLDATSGKLEVPGLKANSIDGDMIKGGTVTAKNLLVGDFANFATIDELNGFTVSSFGQTQIVGGYNKLVTDSGGYLMFTDQRGPVPFSSNDTLYIEFIAKATSPTTVPVGVWTYNAVNGNVNTQSPPVSIGTTDTLVKIDLKVTNYMLDAKTFIVGLNGVANKGIQIKGVKVYKKFGGQLIVDGAIDGKVITGPTIQTDSGATTGIKLTPTELAGWDGTNKNFSLTSGGALTLKGEIKSGSTIQGATLSAGGGGIETSTDSTTGVKLTNTGIKAYDGGNNLSFSVDATTGVVTAAGLAANEIKGDMIAGGAITADKILVGSTANLIPDAAFLSDGITSRRNAASNMVVTKNATTGNLDLTMAGTGNYYFRPTGVDQSAAAYAGWIPVIPGEKYSFSATITTGGTGDLRMTGRAKDGQSTTASFWSAENPYPEFNAGGPTTYNFVGTIPADTFWMLPEIKFSGWVGTASIAPLSLSMRKLDQGELIVDGSIKSNHLKSASIDAGVLVAGSVTGLQMAAKAITADKLLITSTDNLIQEPDFANGGASWTPSAHWSIDPTGGRKAGTPAGKITHTAGQNQGCYNLPMDIPTDGGRAYSLAIWVKSDIVIPTNGIYFEAKVGTLTGTTTYVDIRNNLASIPANTWTLLSGIVKMPVDADTVSFQPTVRTSTPTGTIWIDSPAVTRASNGELIVDGTILTSHLKASSIDASVLTAGSVSAVHIASKSITTDNLVISSTDNLIVGSDFANNGASWTRGTNQIMQPTGGRGGGPAIRLTGTTGINYTYNLANKVAVDPDHRLRVSMWVKTNVAYASDRIRVGIKPWAGTTLNGNVSLFKNDSAPTIPAVPVTVPPAAPVTNPLYIPGTNTWTQITGIMQPLPAGTTHVEFYINCTSPSTTAYVDIDSLAINRATDGTLIVDGTITADKIKAKAITADKMEAELILASKIVAGDISGTHAEMSPTGFKVFAKNLAATGGPPTEAVRLGVANSDDYFAITKADGQYAASISQQGVGSFSTIYTLKSTTISASSGLASGGFYYDGKELTTLLDERPRGVVAAAYRDTSSAYNAAIGGPFQPYLRLEATLVPGRMYKVWTSPIRVNTDVGVGCTVSLSFNNTTYATVDNSNHFTQAFAQPNSNGGRDSLTIQELFTPLGVSVPTVYSFLMSFAIQEAAGGATGQAGMRGSGPHPVRLVVEDVGPNSGNIGSGVSLDGTVAPPPPVNTYVKRWDSNDSRSYRGDNSIYNFDTGRMYQGLSPAGYGNLNSIAMFGVNGHGETMAGAVSGATINYIRVYFNFEHWYYNSGGTARIGLHPHTSLPGSFTYSGNGQTGGLVVTSGGWPKPGARWVDIPSNQFPNFQNGIWKGVVLEGDGEYGTYGYAGRPIIEISYTK